VQWIGDLTALQGLLMTNLNVFGRLRTMNRRSDGKDPAVSMEAALHRQPLQISCNRINTRSSRIPQDHLTLLSTLAPY